MKAIYLVKKGKADQAFEIRDIEQPKPKSGEVGIKVECFGLNYADVMARNGLYREAPLIPCVLGYEVVGTIEAVGENVDPNAIGKRVVAFTRFGGYSQFVTTPFEAIAEIGDLDAGIAACIATQYVTAYYMTEECLNLHEGDKVLIHAGAGGVGQALIQLCKKKGCEIYSTAGSDQKIKLLEKSGVKKGINYRKSDYEEVLKKELNGTRIDVTFNPIAGSTFKKDLRLIGSGGKVVLFGGAERSGKKWGILSSLNFVRKMGLMPPIGYMMTSKSLIGVNMLKIGDNKPEILTRCLKGAANLIMNNELKPLVGAEFKANQIAEAHDLLESRKSIGKVVVYWG